MKKTLLASLALTTACSAFAMPAVFQKVNSDFAEAGPLAPAKEVNLQTRAEEAYNFSYSSGLYSAYRFNGPVGGKSRMFMAFEMKSEDVKLLAGKKVTGFVVYSPTNSNMTSNTIKQGQIFCTTDLTKGDYTQDFTFSTKPFATNEITLETPYTITGEEESLFFGYSLVVPKTDNMYYYPIDGQPSDYEGAALLGMQNDGEGFPTEYQSCSADLGALSMAIKIEGDDLPAFGWFYTVNPFNYIPLNQAYTIEAAVSLLSPAPIESIDIDYTLGGQSQTSHVAFPQAIPAGDVYAVLLDIEIPAQAEFVDEEIMLNLSKINGQPNMSENATISTRLYTLNNPPAHQTLIEEYTGTWCGWCTGGYAVLEYIKKNQPDFVVAAYHNGDPMTVTNSYPSSVSGFPTLYLDRSMSCDPVSGPWSYGGDPGLVNEVLGLNHQLTPWGIEVSHSWSDPNTLVANADVWNVLGFENGKYKIVYILISDGLTGYDQSNYYPTRYSASQNLFFEELNEFCKGGKYGVSTVEGLTFNDVVVSTTGIYGVNGSVPTSLEADVRASHSLTFDLSKIKATLIPDRNKLRVIAAVVDENGVVLNCAKDEVDDYDTNAVENINAADTSVEYYNLNGMKVNDPANGIYIRRQGSKADKVIIK